MSSRFKSDKRFDVATDIVISSSKSTASAVTSKYSGISISAFLPSRLKSRLSFKPGIAMPRTILLLSLSNILPLETVTLLNLSVGRTTPVIIVKGTYASCDLPLTVIVFFSLFM